MRKGQNPRRGRGRNGSMRPMGGGGGQRHGHGNGQGNGQGQGQSQSQQQQGQGRHRRNPGALNRQFDSSGPEGKVRGTAIQLYERYKAASRETYANDPVLSEAYGQFADHYYRVAVENGAFDFDNQSRRDVPERTGDDMDAGDDQEFSEPPVMEAPAAPGRSERRDRFTGEPVAMEAPAAPVTPAPVGLTDGVLRTVAARPAAQPSLLSNLEPPSAPAAGVAPPPPAMAESAASLDEDHGARRPRGRPRKPIEAPLLARSEPPLAVAVIDEPTAAPRRRGRPRKIPLPDPTF